jgi:tetratricopeptide (TPR) repeat protein
MAAGEMLILEARDFKDPQHWRWVLKDGQGKFLADHEVDLDSGDPNYSAFLDLEGFLQANSSPDKWLEDHARFIKQVGSWIGKEVLERVGDRIAKFITPVTVRVQVPPEASGLLYRPWEMALAGGKPLALRNVSLVFEINGEKPVIKEVPIKDRLRMLAVFSLPTDASSLSLRRERYQLMKLINQLAQSYGFAIEMRVLQYGTTRESLREALEEGEGWDLIHFSGHGDKAMLILEKPDGSHDEVSSEELGELLSLASGRLKLVMLSACLSAAATIQETLEWLKIPVAQNEEAPSCVKPGDAPMPALAAELMAKLDCAVLAMRYPVGDEFAIGLASELYRQMLEKGNTLPRSLQLCMQKALKDGYNAATPPLSLATPALFGSRSAEMIIKPPLAPEGEFVTPTVGLAYFPQEPKRFVGRAGPLGRASSALARDSEKRGVLFQGMAGAGKTACALETAYHQSRSHRFRHFVWHEAPKENEEIEGALVKLALDMERQLPGFKMAHLVDRAEEFRDWLPVLSEMLEQHSILIVLDNLENLLTSDGGWKDERWGWLIEALLNHDGLSRIILTSRNPLRNLEGNIRLIVEQIDSLSRNEAMLLAREMPNLGRLLIGKSPVGLYKGRDLVRRTLALVQGHPKLIELADAQAADPEALERYLESAMGAWSEDKDHLDRFFSEGESARSAEEFLKILTNWTQDVSRSLPQASRTLFQFLCALEDEDRLNWVVQPVWPELWKIVGLDGEAPALEPALTAVKSAGLVDLHALGKHVRYLIHPGVSQAGLDEANEKFRLAVDFMMATFWIEFFNQAQIGGAEEKGQMVILAGLRSAPYLMRQKMWQESVYLLERVLYRDRSPETMASVLPLIRFIAMATRGTDRELDDSVVLAKALLYEGRIQEAENMVRSLIPECVAQRKFKWASVAAADLFRIMQNTGRFEEALDLVEDIKSYICQAELGPWTQLMCEGMRMQSLISLGKYDEVLGAVECIRVQMKSLTEESSHEESVTSWHVREGILDAGREAAMRSEKHQKALELNAERLALMAARGATELELARYSMNDSGPLIRLKRYDKAGNLLAACRDVFERERYVEGLGMVFNALADLVSELGQRDQAISFGETAIRYFYLLGNPERISICHNNFAVYLAQIGSKSALDHRLAAGSIFFQIGSSMLASSLIGLAGDFDRFGPEALPESFEQLCDRVEQVDGVQFRELWARLSKRAEDGDQLLKELVEMAKNANP